MQSLKSKYTIIIIILFLEPGTINVIFHTFHLLLVHLECVRLLQQLVPQGHLHRELLLPLVGDVLGEVASAMGQTQLSQLSLQLLQLSLECAYVSRLLQRQT